MVRIISISSISLVLRSAPLARVSKDGHRRDRARGHPSRRPREERGLLRMRSEGLNSIVRYGWFHGIGLLDRVPVILSHFAMAATSAGMTAHRNALQDSGLDAAASRDAPRRARQQIP